jgi:hypothetical protein
MMDDIEHYPTENYQSASDRGKHLKKKSPLNSLDNHTDWEKFPQICIMHINYTDVYKF